MFRILFDALKLLLVALLAVWLAACFGVTPALRLATILELPIIDLAGRLVAIGTASVAYLDSHQMLTLVAAPTTILLCWLLPEGDML